MGKNEVCESRFGREMFDKLMECERKIGQLESDIKWYRIALAKALENGSVVIGADDFSSDVPEISQAFNCADEIVLSVKKKKRLFWRLQDMKIMLDNGAYVPKRAHETDAGLDLYSRYEMIVAHGDSAFFDTGVHIELPRGCVGFIKSKSGLMVNHGIITDGTIDEGYTGSICVKLFNLSDTDYRVKKGDKIAQLVITEYKSPSLEFVRNLEETERGSNGFGSTGR